MKRIVLLVILIFLVRKGYGLFNKYRHAKRLGVGIESFQLEKFKLSNLLGDIKAQVNVGVTNFSSSIFTLDQIKVDVFNMQGELIAEQINPLTEAQTIASNQKSVMPLTFSISSNQLKKLITTAGGAVNVGANLLTEGKYGIPLHLKGIIEAEGISIDINEKIIA